VFVLTKLGPKVSVAVSLNFFGCEGNDYRYFAHQLGDLMLLHYLVEVSW
jgi:hypothetical protein